MENVKFKKVGGGGNSVASKPAFTLAEVLITLGVVGVIAAMILPSLIEHYKEKQTIVALKKSYSILNQAFLMATQEYGPPTDWEGIFTPGGGCTSCAIQIAEIFAQYIQRIEKCYWSSKGFDEDGNPVYDQGENKKCGGTDRVNPLQLNGSEENVLGDIYVSTNFARSIIADGTLFITQTAYNNCANKYGNGAAQNNLCSYIFVDINGGHKKPNQYGVDLFPFYLTTTGLVPAGVQNSYYDNTCKKSSSGVGCTAWVLVNENMDYLHCDDLNWNGKTSCK